VSGSTVIVFQLRSWNFRKRDNERSVLVCLVFSRPAILPSPNFLSAFSFQFNMELPKTLASKHEIPAALTNTNLFVNEDGLLKSNVNIQGGVILLNDKRVSLDELIKIFKEYVRKQ